MWNNSKKIMGVQSLALLALILSVMVLAGCSDDDDIIIQHKPLLIKKGADQ